MNESVITDEPKKTRLELILERQVARWYKLIDHPVQLELVKAVDNGVRFPVVAAGRRSGKSERFKRFLVKRAMAVEGLYFAAAPTYGQVKKIYWDDLKALSLSAMHDRKPSESELKIYLPNGSEIHLLGLDQPSRVEGTSWAGGGIDEIADIKAEAWARNIMPALNTVDPRNPDYRAFCWLLGVPDSLDFYYDLAEYARTSGDPDWQYFHWKSAEILPDDVIETAKRTMSAQQFRIEFEASFEGTSGRIYDDYDDKNYTNETIQPDEQLYWYHDFNYTPMSSGVGVMRGEDFYLLDEIILTSAVARQSALEFVDKYKKHENKHVWVYGDPSGRSGEKHGHESDYTEIERILKENGWTYTRKVKRSTRSIKDGQNAVRARIRNAAGDVFLYVNIKKAPYTHKSLLTGQLKKGSTFLEFDTEYQHIGTAIRYLIDYEFPVNGFGVSVERM
jgi:hypothetical protein